MTHDQYSATFTHWAESAETRLVQLCDAYLPAESRIGQAARYSLLGGGKRIRAVLTLAACELAGASAESALDYACALEMLHCYSLIHDDLPCMDNDDFRRGKPSCHKQFGEDIALLAADALVTAAFEVIANAALPAESRIQAASVLSCAGGARGMLFGQELDKIYEQEPATEEQLRSLHAHKTGALIIAATDLGCAVAGAAPSVRQALNCYAAEVGLVFQIVDDILDVTSTTEELGLWVVTWRITKPPLYLCMDWKVHTVWPMSTIQRPWPHCKSWVSLQIFCGCWLLNCCSGKNKDVAYDIFTNCLELEFCTGDGALRFHYGANY